MHQPLSVSLVVKDMSMNNSKKTGIYLTSNNKYSHEICSS